jgi:hypothetical protein
MNPLVVIESESRRGGNRPASFLDTYYDGITCTIYRAFFSSGADAYG